MFGDLKHEVSGPKACELGLLHSNWDLNILHGPLMRLKGLEPQIFNGNIHYNNWSNPQPSSLAQIRVNVRTQGHNF